MDRTGKIPLGYYGTSQVKIEKGQSFGATKNLAHINANSELDGKLSAESLPKKKGGKGDCRKAQLLLFINIQEQLHPKLSSR